MVFNLAFKRLMAYILVNKISSLRKSMVYFNTVLNTTIYNYLKCVYIKSLQHVSVVHSTIVRP